jgi:hypothetical protein
MRVGLAYESSTWYNLSDELSQKLVSVSSSSTGDDINDVSRLTLIFYAPYKLQTPSKLTGSFAYVLEREA